jgi:hypothetical protein
MTGESSRRCGDDCYSVEDLQQRAFPETYYEPAHRLLVNLLARETNGPCIRKDVAARILKEVCRKPIVFGGVKVSLLQWLGRDAANRSRRLGPVRAEYHVFAGRIAEHILDRILARGTWDPSAEDAKSLPTFISKFLRSEMEQSVLRDTPHAIPPEVLDDYAYNCSQTGPDEDTSEDEQSAPYRPRLSQVQRLAMEVQIAEHRLLEILRGALRGKVRREPVWREKLRTAFPAVVRLHRYAPELYPRKTRERDPPGTESDVSPPFDLEDLLPSPLWNVFGKEAKVGKNPKQVRSTIGRALAKLTAEVQEQPLLCEIVGLRTALCGEIERRLSAELAKLERQTQQVREFEQRLMRRLEFYQRPFLLIEL